jgi:hypothetical protein
MREIDTELLASAVADAVRPWLPAGFEIEAARGWLIVKTADHVDYLPLKDNILLNVDEKGWAEAAASATSMRLEELQTVVTLHLTSPWPAVDGDRSAFQEPFAYSRDDRLHFGFGDASPGAPMTAVVAVPWK